MGRSQDSFNKREKEKKRRKKKQEKLERREQRKAEKAEKGTLSFEDNLTYVDENGNFTKTPPDPSKKSKIKAEDIVLGVPPKEEGEDDPVRNGQVKFFNEEKGYGFIIDDVTKESVFVHINNLTISIKDKDRVSFEVEMGAKGPNAINIKLQN